MRKKVTKLKRKYTRKPTERNYNAYLEKVSEYKKFCKQSRDDDFMETLPDIQSLSNFHKNVSKQKPPQINSLRKLDGSYSIPGLDTAKTITKAHFPSQVPLMATTYSGKVLGSSEIMSANIDWVTDELIVQAMSGFQAKKSPGTDGLKPVIFQHLPANMIKYLNFIYKA